MYRSKEDPYLSVADASARASAEEPTLDGNRAWSAAVQRKILQRAAARRAEREDAASVHDAAAHGTEGPGGPLPHLDTIQRAFGQHDVSGVRAHVGTAATESARAMNAEAFATGNDVAFAGSPSLHTAAHEAAHVVQQRSGVHLKGGVGVEGDTYEQHADAVADAVVAGRSAEALLDAKAPASGTATGASGPVQRKFVGDLQTKTVDDIYKALAPFNSKMPMKWKITQLMNDSKVFRSLAEVAEALGLNAPPATNDSSVDLEPPKPLPKETPQSPGLDVAPERPKQEESEKEEKPVKVGPGMNEEEQVRSSQYTVTKPLGDGSHHQAWALEGTEEWVLLENAHGKIEQTVQKRRAAYATFPDSIVAKMGDIVTLPKKSGGTVRGVLLEKITGDAFHSTRQAWGFGLKKTVERWKEEDKVSCKERILRTMQGMDTFINAGQVVDDFQYWVTDDGYFKLTDVKTSQVGNTKLIHKELVNCRAQLELVLRSLD